MVQITHARLYDETGKPVRIAADRFDKAIDGKKICLCPDEKCNAMLTHYNEHLHTYYDVDTNEAYRLKIPSYFKRAAGSPPHDIACTAVDQYTIYQNYARDLGAVSHQHGSFIYNLNILTDDFPAPIRQRRALSPEFSDAAPVRERKSENREAGASAAPRKLSEGLNHVKKLAGLLDRTQFEKEYRAAVLLRDGARRYKLSDIFKDDTVNFFRSEHARAKEDGARYPALVQFRPIVLSKFHSKKDRTIQGQAYTVKGADGHDYSVSVQLHCETKEIYQAVKKEIAARQRSFLVYTDKAYVDLMEFAHKKHEIQMGTAKDRTVFVHIHVRRPEQITAWVPYNGQLGLEEAGLEMPDYRRPPREFPAGLLKTDLSGPGLK